MRGEHDAEIAADLVVEHRHRILALLQTIAKRFGQMRLS